MRSVNVITENSIAALSRRRFLTGMSALVVGFAFAGRASAMVSPNNVDEAGAADAAASGFDGFVPDGFIRISSDGRIYLVVPSAEMGQGIATTEAMLVAEELEVGLDQIEVALAPPDLAAYGQSILKNQMTGGSTSVRAFYGPLRKAGAVARTMIVNGAAQEWGVSASECKAVRGSVIHIPSARTLTYAALVDAAKRQPVPLDVTLKDPRDFTLIGTPSKRVDTPEKVSGSAKFGIDVVVEGMRYAAITMCPTIGGFVKTVDATLAKSYPGVVDVLKIDDAVAVVGENYWAAKKGLDLLEVEWDYGPHTTLSSADLWSQLETSTTKPIVAKVVGNPDKALGSGIRIEATYKLPFLAHAALEPVNTTIHAREDSCDVWVSTQVPVDAQTVVAEILGLPPKNVSVHTHLIGGGFGRRLAVDTIQQAARFARLADYPLKIIWTREQDIQHDRFRPAYLDRVTATLDPETRLPKAFHHHTTGATVLQYFTRKPYPDGKMDPDLVAGSVDMPYRIPAAKWEWRRQDSAVAVNWWRGVGEGHNVFVVESFIDELALAAGYDPVEYRKRLLGASPRALAVLKKRPRRQAGTPSFHPELDGGYLSTPASAPSPLLSSRLKSVTTARSQLSVSPPLWTAALP